MRYRSSSTTEQLTQDAARFSQFLGGKEWFKALLALGKALNHKGYVTTFDDLKFSLERELLQLEISRLNSQGQLKGMHPQLHSATDFVLGVGQTIPHLSSSAAERLKKRIHGHVRNDGLRSLCNEFRIAGFISNQGFDVTFSDLESNTGKFDFLAQRNGLSFEVEGKSITPYLGHPIDPEDSEKLFLALRRQFNASFISDEVPIFDIRLVGRLEVNSQRIDEVAEACIWAKAEEIPKIIEEYASINHLGTVSIREFDQLNAIVKVEKENRNSILYFSQENPRFVVRISSSKASKFTQKVLGLIGQAAKKQFSGNFPGVIWVHVDFISPQQFDALATNPNGPSFFGLVAMAVLLSPKRSHISQLIFSGGSFLTRKGKLAQSNIRRVIFNSPNCRFGTTYLFQGGSIMENPDANFEEKAKSILREAKMFFTIESGPREEAKMSERKFVEWVSNKNQLELRRGVISRLFMQALQASESGQIFEAIELYEEILKLLPKEKDDLDYEMYAAASYNRANQLSELGNYEEAIKAYEELAEEISSTSLPQVADKLVQSLYNSAVICDRDLDQKEKAIAYYRSVLAKANDNPALFSSDIVAKTYVNLGLVSESADYAISCFDEVVTRFLTSETPDLLEQVQKALINKANLLNSHEHYMDALNNLEKAINLSGAQNIELSLHARARKVMILGDNRRDEEILTVSGLENGLAPMISSETKIASICALLVQADALRRNDRDSEAAEIYEFIISELCIEVDEKVLNYVAVVYSNWTGLLFDSGHGGAAFSTCKKLIALHEKLSISYALTYVSWALFVQSQILANRGDIAGAAATCSSIMQRFASESKTPSEEIYFQAVGERAAHLYDLAEYDAALPLCDEYLERARKPNPPITPLGVARTLLCKGMALLKCRQPLEAKQTLQGLVREFGTSSNTEICAYVDYARSHILDISDEFD